MGIQTSFKKFIHNPRVEVLSGLTVGIALVPEAIAFALIAGVEPLVGLYAAFLVCLITSLFGGRPGMISGATGALAVVMVSLVTTHGVEYLFATVVLMGILQMLAGILHLGRFIKMVPHSVMIGFVNGLAIVIFLAQLNQFKTMDDVGNQVWMSGTALYKMLGIVAFTMALTYIFPKITRKVPSALMAIIASTALVLIFKIDTKTVGDISSIAGTLPQFHLPMVEINLETLRVIFPYALILATIGLIESLLTLTLIDDITNTKLNKNSRECFFQGVANFVTGFFGGMGGCAMIGQSMINVRSGGRSRLSGFSAAIFLILFILFFSSLIELIPIATLTGIMFVVVIATFEWSSIKIINKIPKADFLVIIAVTVITVLTDLAIAVISGVIISSLVFSWKSAQNVHAKTSVKKGDLEDELTYTIYGQIFFASIERFKSIFPATEKHKNIVIDFANTRIWDHSALEAVEYVAQKYLSAGKNLKLIHLSSNCKGLLDKAENCIVSSPEDPNYRMAVKERDALI